MGSSRRTPIERAMPGSAGPWCRPSVPSSTARSITRSSIYGKSGDIFTLAASNIFHRDGAGTATDSGNFRGTAVDLLIEKVLPNKGVVTLLGEYKNYEISSLNEDVARGYGLLLSLRRFQACVERPAV